MTATLWTPQAEFLGSHAPGTEAWAAARRGRLGGSEVAAVLGLSPFESRFSLWHRKRGLVGDVDDRPEMEWGRRLEDPVAVKFADTHPEYHVHPGGAWRNHHRPWQVGHPDRLLHPTGGGTPLVLEVKTAVNDLGWGDELTDDVPVYYRIQVFHYLHCLGLTEAWLVVLIGGFDYREYRVTLDLAEQEANAAACVEFLAEVADGRRPAIDEHDQTYQVLRELHPDITPESVTLNPDTVARYDAANAAFTAAKAEKQHATSLVADEMGHAREAWTDDRKVAIRMAKDGGLPFVKAHPIPKTKTTTARKAAA